MDVMKTPGHSPSLSARTQTSNTASLRTVTASSAASNKTEIILPLLECKRLEQLLSLQGTPRSSPRPPNSIPSPNSKRPNTKPPSALKQAHPPPASTQQEVYDSEYASLSRSKSRLQMIIREDVVMPRGGGGHMVAAEVIPQTPCPPEFSEMVEKLKTQVADLSLFLEEERLNHRETRRRAEELMGDKVHELRDDHKAALKRLHIDHEDEKQKIRQQCQQSLDSERMELGKQIAKLKTDLELLQGAFHTYKTETEMSHRAEFREEKLKLSQQLQDQHERELATFEIKLRNELNDEMNKIEHRHSVMTNELKHDQRKSLEMLKWRYSNHEGDLVELQVTREKLESVTKELEEMTLKTAECEEYLNDMKLKYSDSKVLLLNQESKIADRVKDMEAKYKGQNDDLLEANSHLRLQYLRKCEELFELSAKIEVQKQEEASNCAKPCKRLRRLMRTQSMIEMSKLESRGFTKNLFSQLHVHDLNTDLAWWLTVTHQKATSPTFAQPLPKIYEEALAKAKSAAMSKYNESELKLPSIPVCHQTRDIKLRSQNTKRIKAKKAKK